MKRSFLVLILLVMISIFCCSQNSYPKKIVFDNDTCIALSIDLVKTLNLKLQRKSYLEERNILIGNHLEDNKLFIGKLQKELKERDRVIIQYGLEADKANELMKKERDINAKLIRRFDRGKTIQRILLFVSAISITALVVK